MLNFALGFDEAENYGSDHFEYDFILVAVIADGIFTFISDYFNCYEEM